MRRSTTTRPDSTGGMRRSATTRRQHRWHAEECDDDQTTQVACGVRRRGALGCGGIGGNRKTSSVDLLTFRFYHTTCTASLSVRCADLWATHLRWKAQTFTLVQILITVVTHEHVFSPHVFSNSLKGIKVPRNACELASCGPATHPNFSWLYTLMVEYRSSIT